MLLLSVRLTGRRIMEAQKALYDYLGAQPDAVIALEIGGGNGLQGRYPSLILWNGGR